METPPLPRPLGSPASLRLLRVTVAQERYLTPTASGRTRLGPALRHGRSRERFCSEAEGSPGPSPASQLTQLQGTELRRVKVALWPGPTRACRSSGGPAGPVCHGDEETESLHGLQHTHGALQAEPLGRRSLAPTRPARPSQAQPLNQPQ